MLWGSTHHQRGKGGIVKWTPEKTMLAHEDWAARMRGTIGAALGGIKGPVVRNKIAGNSQISIGIVSPDFRDHSVAMFMGWLQHMDPHMHRVTLYHCGPTQDDVTDDFRAEFEMVDIFRKDLRHVCEMLDNARHDVLVDLAGHTKDSGLVLFLARRATVQLSYLGYPGTTGVDTIDYKIVDWRTDPVGYHRHYTEILWRLPWMLCYDLESTIGEHQFAPLKREDFGCCATTAKITDEVLRAWADITSRSCLKVRLKNRSTQDPGVCASIMERWGKAGGAPGSLIIVPPTRTRIEHLHWMHRRIAMLDTWPYNGTTVTCEALCARTPVVTLVGDRHAARVGYSIASAAAPEYPLVITTNTVDEYVIEGIDHGRDCRYTEAEFRLDETRLCDPVSFANNFSRDIGMMLRAKGVDL